MPTQIDTSTNPDATGAANQALIQLAPSDNSAIVIYFGNNGPELATAQSPYSSWAKQAIGSATTRNGQAFVTKSDDSLDIMVQSPGNNAYFFRATRSVNTWTLSALGTIAAYNSAGANADSAFGLKDSQGRVWLGGNDDVAATYQVYAAYTANDNVPFTTSANTPLNLGEQNRAGLGAGLVGNYLVLVFDSGAGGLQYTRLDVSQVALGAWSTPAAVTGVSDVSTSSVLALKGVPGGSKGVLTYNSANGIKALVYDAVADTWGAATVLSASANDKHCSLTPGNAGEVYALWCQFSAANSYALVYKKFSGSTWDTNPTTIEAAGGNIAWPHAAWNATASQLALIYTLGAASPYSIEFDTYTPAAGGTTYNVKGETDGVGQNQAQATVLVHGESDGIGQNQASGLIISVRGESSGVGQNVAVVITQATKAPTGTILIVPGITAAIEVLP